jgi:hypothetical protein
MLSKGYEARPAMIVTPSKGKGCKVGMLQGINQDDIHRDGMAKKLMGVNMK